METGKFKALILDSGAFISFASITGAAEEYYSIEEVMSEVRDKQARGALERFPFEIKIRHPTPEAISAVEQFAKATGDFTRLSQTDLLLIALEYDLQKELVGIDSINISPLLDRSRIVDVHDKRIIGINVSSHPCKFFDNPENCRFGIDCCYAHKGDIDRNEYEKEQQAKKAPKPTPIPTAQSSTPALSENASTEAPKREPKRWGVVKPVTPVKLFDDESFPAFGEKGEEQVKEEEALYNNPEIKAIFTVPQPREIPVKEVKEEEEGMNSFDGNENEDNLAGEMMDLSSSVTLAPTQTSSFSSRIHVSSNLVSSTMGTSNDSTEDAEDDGGEWITSSTLSSFETNLHMEQKNTLEEETRDGKVACCTGDYSMQNVILQMNMGLLSYDNKRITNLRVYTRRCRDCFSVCNDDTKLFCQDCGHPSLVRVPVFIKKGGIVRIGDAYETRNLRGTKYSIGKNDDLLLCEDQLKMGKWKQRLYEINRAKKDGCIFGDVGSESLGLENNSKNVPAYMNGLVVGFGRKNPNEMKGRVKRGKKKAKTSSRF